MRLSLLIMAVVTMVSMPTQGISQPQGGGFQGPGGGGSRRGGGGGRGGWGDPNQMFNNFANGKDVWTQADAANNPLGQRMFERISQALNITNGQITREQFATYMQQRQNNWGGFGGGGGRRGNNGQGPAGGSPGAAPAQGGTSNGPGNGGNGPDQWAEMMFRRLDTNGDGLLNYDEMPEALRAERDKWDENKDGFIDLTEYKKYFQAVVQQRMAANGGSFGNWQGGDMPPLGAAPVPEEEEEVKKPVVYRAGNLPKDIPDWFKQIDSDGDGQIGLYEWKVSGRSLEEFRKIDRNNDGFLTIDEVMRYVAEQKKANGGAPSPSGTVAQGPNGNQGFGRRPRGGGFQGPNGGNRNRSDRSRGG